MDSEVEATSGEKLVRVSLPPLEMLGPVKVRSTEYE